MQLLFLFEIIKLEKPLFWFIHFLQHYLYIYMFMIKNSYNQMLSINQFK